MASSVRTRAGTQRHVTTAEPRVGDRLGDYHLSLELARGGMATVFLARAPARAGMHRFVAVKCIRKELASDPRFIEMFFDEARIAAQIQHANVCSVLDFDVWRGTYFLVMEYLPGRSMAEIRRGFARETDVWDTELQTGIVARMLADACEGLHSVHELCDLFGEPLNVVHRDISPGNLFVTYDGNVKVIDFGVAYGSGERQHKTRTGVVKGKYGYLAPELLEGKRPDRRADIWGLGVVAWELLTHQRLFDRGNELETLAAISRNEPPPPSSIRADIPKTLDEIVMSALQRDPDRRCESARALGRAFNGYLVDSDLCVGLAEVSEAMTALFPEGRALNRKLLQVADQIEEMTVAEIDALGGVCLETQCEDIEVDESAVIESAPAGPTQDPVATTGARLVNRAATQVRDRLGAGLAGAAAAMLLLILSPCAPLTPASFPPVTVEPPLETRAPGVADHSRVTVVEDYDEATGEIILRLRPAAADTPEPSTAPFPPVVRNSHEAPLMGPSNGT